MFSAVSMKNCGCQNVGKHSEIKGSDKYVTFKILLEFDSLHKMNIISSESKDNVRRSEMGLITSLVLKTKVRPNKYKKERYAIGNVSKKDLSKIIREFKKLPYEIYEKKRHKHEPTDSYFYLARQLANCMMRSDALNLHSYPAKT